MWDTSSLFHHSVVSDFATNDLQHAKIPCPSLSSRVSSNLCLLSQWCHPTISSSVTSFSLCPQSFPASGSFQMSRLLASGGQSIGTSASASVLPMTITFFWLSLFWSPCSLRDSWVFSSTTVQKHQFFSAQSSLWSSSHIHTCHWKLHSFDYTDICWQSDVSAFEYTV